MGCDFLFSHSSSWSSPLQMSSENCPTGSVIRRKPGETFVMNIQRSYLAGIFTADILTCHKRKGTGVTNNSVTVSQHAH